ncbi:MAG TPA: VOC family protein [Acidimicrobiales bacterium]|nr:VOC family protein [Acidimicrobiales bacterium]
MTAPIRLGSVSLDCPDPSALARFYATLLGVEVAYDSEGFAAVRLDGLWLSMQKIENYRPPTWPESNVPQQVHLDFAVADLAVAEDFAIAAGATKADDQPRPDGWRVLIDPAGHPFCVTTLIPE